MFNSLPSRESSSPPSLPAELFFLVLKRLNVKSLSILRSVSKEQQSLVDNFLLSKQGLSIVMKHNVVRRGVQFLKKRIYSIADPEARCKLLREIAKKEIEHNLLAATQTLHTAWESALLLSDLKNQLQQLIEILELGVKTGSPSFRELLKRAEDRAINLGKKDDLLSSIATLKVKYSEFSEAKALELLLNIKEKGPAFASAVYYFAILKARHGDFSSAKEIVRMVDVDPLIYCSFLWSIALIQIHDCHSEALTTLQLVRKETEKLSDLEKYISLFEIADFFMEDSFPDEKRVLPSNALFIYREIEKKGVFFISKFKSLIKEIQSIEDIEARTSILIFIASQESIKPALIMEILGKAKSVIPQIKDPHKAINRLWKIALLEEKYSYSTAKDTATLAKNMCQSVRFSCSSLPEFAKIEANHGDLSEAFQTYLLLGNPHRYECYMEEIIKIGIHQFKTLPKEMLDKFQDNEFYYYRIFAEIERAAVVPHSKESIKVLQAKKDEIAANWDQSPLHQCSLLSRIAIIEATRGDREMALTTLDLISDPYYRCKARLDFIDREIEIRKAEIKKGPPAFFQLLLQFC